MTIDRGKRTKGDWREVPDGQTLAEALRDEMRLRGHNGEDAARFMGTSSANISRWTDPIKPTVPDHRSAESARNIRKLVIYLRLRHISDYGRLFFSSVMGDDTDR